MRMRTNELMLYRHMEDGKILNDMTFLMENYNSDYYNTEDLKGLLYECVNAILEMTVSHGFEGNLWHNYLTCLLAGHENAYSTSCEIVGAVEGSVNEVALHDFEVFKELFDYDFAPMEKELKADCLAVLSHYKGNCGHGKVFNRRIRDRILSLSQSLAAAGDAGEFKNILTQFYKEFGVGKLGLHKAFRVEHAEGGAKIIPITKIAHVHLDDLVGYEIAKEKLTANTEAFVEGRRANNCLLFGDAGTGKSATVKAVANELRDEGIRLIELNKSSLHLLPGLLDELAGQPLKFILFIDDLSFRENDDDFAALKAVLEGSASTRSRNTVIYATSNRRHIVKETFQAREGDEIHRQDTMQETVSLSERFGLRVYFEKPDKALYLQIVDSLAKREGIREKDLVKLAEQFALRKAGRSARAARQLVDQLAAKDKGGETEC